MSSCRQPDCMPYSKHVPATTSRFRPDPTRHRKKRSCSRKLGLDVPGRRVIRQSIPRQMDHDIRAAQPIERVVRRGRKVEEHPPQRRGIEPRLCRAGVRDNLGASLRQRRDDMAPEKSRCSSDGNGGHAGQLAASTCSPWDRDPAKGNALVAEPGSPQHGVPARGVVFNSVLRSPPGRRRVAPCPATASGVATSSVRSASLTAFASTSTMARGVPGRRQQSNPDAGIDARQPGFVDCWNVGDHRHAPRLRDRERGQLAVFDELKHVGRGRECDRDPPRHQIGCRLRGAGIGRDDDIGSGALVEQLCRQIARCPDGSTAERQSRPAWLWRAR